MNQRQQLESRRRNIVEEMLAIRSLRKGSINEQWFPAVRGGKKTEERRGPYFVFTYKADGRTVSERLKSEAALARAREDADNYRRFKSLCSELEALTAALGDVERQEHDEAEQVKKKPRSPSNKARKSRG